MHSIPLRNPDARHWTGWAVFAAGSLVGFADTVRWLTHHG